MGMSGHVSVGPLRACVKIDVVTPCFFTENKNHRNYLFKYINMFIAFMLLHILFCVDEVLLYFILHIEVIQNLNLI
jgi:hypothetical protein